MDPFVYDFCTFGLFFRLYMIFALFYEGSSGYLIVDKKMPVYGTHVFELCTIMSFSQCE